MQENLSAVGALGLAPRALFLEEDAYRQIIKAPNPFATGLIFIIIIAAILTITSGVGTTLEWMVTPDMLAIKERVWDAMTQQPWFLELEDQEPDALEGFREGYDWGWRVFPGLFGAPDTTAISMNQHSNIFTLLVSWILRVIPMFLGMLFWWIVYAILAHLSAKILGGSGPMNHTFGAVALATSPQLLNVLGIIPYVSLGGVIGIWGLICNFIALKSVHDLSPGRAFWATVLPFIILTILGIILGILVFFIVGLVTAGGGI